MSVELLSGSSGGQKLPCGVGSVEELENLVRGTLLPEQAVEVSAHADCCPVCAKELAWLRAEAELFAQRARGVPPSLVWSKVEAQLSQRLAAQLGQRPAGTRWRDRFRAQSLQWLAVGAAAAMLGIVAASPLSPLRLRDSLSSLLGRSLLSGAVTDGGRAAMVQQLSEYDKDDDAGSAGDEERSLVSAAAKVSGAVTVSLSTQSADVEVVVGKAGEVKLTAADGDARAVRLVDQGKGRLLAEFDGQSHLRSGEVRLELPAGSSVEIRTISGEVTVGEILGDVTVTTTSGDLHVKAARKVALTSTSGEALIERASGAVTVQTISGDLALQSEVVAPVKFSSVSGDLQLLGTCRAGCQVSATTLSGDVSVHGANASLVARLRSRSGEIAGADGLAIEMRRRPGDKSEWTVHLGRSEGRVDLDSESGGLNLHSAK